MNAETLALGATSALGAIIGSFWTVVSFLSLTNLHTEYPIGIAVASVAILAVSIFGLGVAIRRSLKD